MRPYGLLHRAFRQGWSQAPGRWIQVGRFVAVLTLLLLGCGNSSTAQAVTDLLPTGEAITAGSGSIGRAGSQMVIDQATNRMAIDWQKFSIGQNNSVTFNQPSSSAIALNRVLGSEVSQIQGALNANGRVFLLNPNGVVFGSGSQVSVGGLVASTLELGNADFLGDHFTFSGDSAGSVINQGDIRAADGGTIALIAATIDNSGSLSAYGGNVLLGAGSKVTLDLGGPVKLEVEEATIDTLIAQGGAIKADGGLVYLTAKSAGDLASSVINHSGITEAQTLVTGESGEIYLMGNMNHGRVEVGGILDASAPNGGDGGFIETSAAKVKIADDAHITTLAATGETGTWLIDPTNYTIMTGGDISPAALASGLTAGNVVIQTADEGSAAGHITIFEAINWSSDNDLTLNAHGDITSYASITNNSGGSLTLRADLDGNGSGSLYFSGGASISLTGGGRADLYYHPYDPATNIPTSYAAPTDFSAVMGSTPYTGWMLVNDPTQLQAMNTNLGGAYALGRDIDAAVTADWNAGAGFAPVGSPSSYFTGQLDGLGHTISGLTIDRPSTDDVGLFGHVSGAIIRNVGMVGGSINGYRSVGGLVGYNNFGSIISNAYTTGNVNGNSYVGGLAGYNTTATVIDSYATGNVSGTNTYIGGLVGVSEDSCIITDSYATGDVTGGSIVGGLLGSNDGSSTVNNAYATGTVSGNNTLGGLVGNNHSSSITSAYATGSVTGGDHVGGLVGNNSGSSITNAYAIGSVTGDDHVGGLVGYFIGDTSNIINSYATGNVTGTSNVGGLVGYNAYGSIASAYATGDVSIPGTNSNVGGLAGYNYYGTITNSYATGSVSGRNEVGGLVGTNYAGNITNTYASGDVRGWTYVGGLVGYDEESTIGNTYATGSVTGYNNATGTSDGSSQIGGLVGETDYSSISNSYSTGRVTGSIYMDDVGGLVGKNYSTSISNSYWDTETSGLTTSAGGTGKTTAEMMTEALAGFDFTTTWWRDAGNTRPFLRSEYSTSISNAHQLQLMALDLGADYTLAADIGMTELNQDSGLWNTATGFVPVGQWISDYSDTFTGTFDGDGHTIGDLFINSSTYENVGLFGFTYGATIRNVGLVGGSISGVDIVGGLVGRNYDSTISNAYITANVTGTDYVGGLVGINYQSNISNSYATGNVDGGYSIGGLVGYNSGSSVSGSYATGTVTGDDKIGGLAGRNMDSTITTSYASGNVTGGGGSQDYFFIGGLVGDNTYSGIGSTISESYATGSVTGSGDAFVGGLVGYNTGTIETSFATGNISGYQVGGLVGQNASSTAIIENVYATGTVTGNDPGSSVTGGLVGYNNNGATISNAYATGLVSVGSSQGGLAGYSTGTITDSYWNRETTGQLTSLVASGENTETLASFGKTTGEMQSLATFTGWDISAQGGESSLWRIYEGATAPLLRSFFIAAPTLSVTAEGKVYDGTTSLSGGSYLLEAGYDRALVQDASATYHAASKDVGTRGILMQGLYSNQTDYDLIISSTDTVEITRAPLTVTGVGANDKVYDATSTATLNGTAAVAAFGDDVLTLDGTGSAGFTDPNVGTGKTVTISGYTLGGADAANYTLSQPTGVTADITPAPLTVTADDKSKVYGDANPTLTASYVGFKGSDTDAVITGLILATAATAASNAGDYAITAEGGTATNYSLSFVDGVLTITPVSVPPPGPPAATPFIGGGEPLLAAIETVQNLVPAMNPGMSGGTDLRGGGVPLASMRPHVEVGRHSRSGGLDFVEVADVDALAQVGQDNFGFMRVFVVNGGINLPGHAHEQTKGDE